ncbi:Hypothetical protein GbCGDNIH4_7231 [Granulibacter bethesdensis CGDNIH4]|nr:Hypothetical protein GbCGDNIH4_7231 [Granulibacter bethesdensis CGDNIH4]
MPVPRQAGEGLSPRTRGNPVIIDCINKIKRTIPAHAGEPQSLARADSREKDYPRARGGTSRADVIDFKEQSLFSTF